MSEEGTNLHHVYSHAAVLLPLSPMSGAAPVFSLVETRVQGRIDRGMVVADMELGLALIQKCLQAALTLVIFSTYQISYKTRLCWSFG